MASHEVVDPSIANSGNNLKTVEVGYRKNSGDGNTYVDFYRTKEDAQPAAEASKQQAEDDAKVDAEIKASDAEWKKKLTSLPYMIANHDAGFKLAYAVCKPAGKKPEVRTRVTTTALMTGQTVSMYRIAGSAICRGVRTPNLDINTKHPADVGVNRDDALYVPLRARF